MCEYMMTYIAYSFMLRRFTKNRDVIRRLWNQFDMRDDEVQEIVKMSHVDISHLTQVTQNLNVYIGWLAVWMTECIHALSPHPDPLLHV